jgi:hypothetical protein
VLISLGCGRKQSLYAVTNDGDHLRKSPNNQVALDAFLARKAEIDTMLERLTALSGDHFNASPGEIDWGRDARPLRRTPEAHHRRRLQGGRTRRVTLT